jgi:plastocyanin
MPSRPLIALLLLLVLAAGCGDEEKSADTPAPASGGDPVQVEMKDILFVPENITARVGQTVVWTNQDDVEHDVKADKGADFESKALAKGDTYEAKMTEAGTIDYLCTIHPSQRGSITVEPQ